MKNFLTKFRDVWRPFAESSVSLYASAACYYTLISIPAASLTLFRLFSDFPWLKSVLSLIPDAIRPLGENLFISVQQKTRGILSFVIALWSAAKISVSVTDGFRHIFSLPSTGFLQRRFRGILTLILGSLFTAAAILTILICYGILSALSPAVPVGVPVIYRILFSFTLLFFMLAGVYKNYSGAGYLPVLLSAFAGALAWVISAEAFSLYIRLKVSPLSGIFAGILWLRSSLAIILYGGVLCRILSRKK